MMKQGKKLQNTLTTGELIFGWIYVAAQQFVVPLILILVLEVILTELGLPLTDLWLNFAFFAVNFIVVVSVCHKFLIKSLRQFGKRIGHVLCNCAAGFTFYMSANILVNVLVTLCSPDFSNSNDAYIQTLAGEQFWIMLISTVVLVPIVEETLYRGVVFGTLDRFNRPLAYILSSLIFAAIHVVGYIGTEGFTVVDALISLLQYLPASVSLAWIYASTDTIFAPTLVHMSVNLIAVLSMR